MMKTGHIAGIVFCIVFAMPIACAVSDDPHAIGMVTAFIGMACPWIFIVLHIYGKYRKDIDFYISNAEKIISILNSARSRHAGVSYLEIQTIGSLGYDYDKRLSLDANIEIMLSKLHELKEG